MKRRSMMVIVVSCLLVPSLQAPAEETQSVVLRMDGLRERDLSQNLSDAREANLSGNRGDAVRLYGVALEQAQATGDDELQAVIEESAQFFAEIGSMRRVRPALLAYFQRAERPGQPQSAAYLLEPARLLLSASIDADDPAGVEDTAQRLLAIVSANPELNADLAFTVLEEVQLSYIRYGRLEAADDLHRRFAPIIDRYDTFTPALATLYDTMARMHLGPEGDPFKAERHWQDALAATEAVYGAASPEVADTLENLAAVQGILEREDDQETSLLRVLAIRQQGTAQPGSPDATRALLALSSHYRARDDDEAADRYGELAREACEAAGGFGGEPVGRCGALAPSQ